MDLELPTTIAKSGPSVNLGTNLSITISLMNTDGIELGSDHGERLATMDSYQK